MACPLEHDRIEVRIDTSRDFKAAITAVESVSAIALIAIVVSRDFAASGRLGYD
jgi:hypothetical protein